MSCLIRNRLRIYSRLRSVLVVLSPAVAHDVCRSHLHRVGVCICFISFALACWRTRSFPRAHACDVTLPSFAFARVGFAFVLHPHTGDIILSCQQFSHFRCRFSRTPVRSRSTLNRIQLALTLLAARVMTSCSHGMRSSWPDICRVGATSFCSSVFHWRCGVVFAVVFSLAHPCDVVPFHSHCCCIVFRWRLHRDTARSQLTCIRSAPVSRLSALARIHSAIVGVVTCAHSE